VHASYATQTPNRFWAARLNVHLNADNTASMIGRVLYNLSLLSVLGGAFYFILFYFILFYFILFYFKEQPRHNL
jgi:hypothetical protein